MEHAYFAAGCFWCVQQRFSRLPGVHATRAGYMGGHTQDPTYREVCSDTTGHAEAVEVAYDPTEIDYPTLLSCFFEWHDPTQVNRQGPDIGSQYRSAVFPTNDLQRLTSEQKIASLNGSSFYSRPIATRIEPIAPFYAAEDYHQDYLDKRGVSHCGL